MKKVALLLLAAFLASAGLSSSAAELSAENGLITASDAPEGSTLITAVYRDGSLMKIHLYRGSGTITADPSADIGGIEYGDTIKAFLWDMGSLFPVCDPLTTDLETLYKEDDRVTVTINGHEFSAVLYDNETARAFKTMLPMTVTMNELNGNEKYYYLDRSLPADSTRPGTIREGDLMLYGSNCLVLFYETFQSSYSYTNIGYIEDTSGLRNALGTGSVTVSYR